MRASNVKREFSNDLRLARSDVRVQRARGALRGYQNLRYARQID
jgi:hypothetical protein